MPFDGYRPTIIAHFGAGAQTVGVNRYRWVAPGRGKIVDVKTNLHIAPSGASFIVDVNINGTTIYTNQSNRPTIPINGFTASGGVQGVRQVAENQTVSVDVDQIGSSVAGSELSVTIQFIPDEFA